MPKIDIPAFKCRMGSRNYYVTTWKFGLISSTINYAKDIPGYDSMIPEEQLQREINWNNVKKRITPYLVTNEERFFGAIIVEIYKGKPVFKEYGDLENVGTLTLQDDFMMYALDGQHRLAAIKEALQESQQLSSEVLTVILVEHENSQKTRKLFTHINKNAKPTSTAVNILLDEEDILSRIARNLEREIPLFKDNINWKGNTLSDKSPFVTTAKVLYRSAEIWLDEYQIRPGHALPNEETEVAYCNEVIEIWNALIEEISWLSLVAQGEDSVVDLRTECMLMKPVGQMAMIEAVQNARIKDLSISEIAKSLEEVDWSFEGKLWNSIIYNPALQTVINAKKNVQHAGMLLGYTLGGEYNDDDEQELLDIQRAYEGQPQTLHEQISAK